MLYLLPHLLRRLDMLLVSVTRVQHLHLALLLLKCTSPCHIVTRSPCMPQQLFHLSSSSREWVPCLPGSQTGFLLRESWQSCVHGESTERGQCQVKILYTHLKTKHTHLHAITALVLQCYDFQLEFACLLHVQMLLRSNLIFCAVLLVL